MYKVNVNMHSIIRSFIVFFMFGVVTVSCTTSKRSSQADKVEKLQNSTEYSAVDSEWNELYQ